MQRQRNEDLRLDRTPALERLLARLSAALTRQIWLSGLGSVLLVAVAWLAFAFLADYVLRVPHGVRLFHALVAVALPAFVAWRRLARPMAARPTRAGTAVILERERPQTRDLFVSAVQLQQTPPHEATPTLVDDVLANAEAAARDADIEGVLDPRAPRRLAFAGVGVAVLAVVAAMARPELASTFAARMFDPSVRWPQRTHLSIQVPLGPDKASVSERDGRLWVRVARGTDLPVQVKVDGAAPEEVELTIAGADSLILVRGSDGSYRTVLRALQQDLDLRARGGDDDGARAQAHVEVLLPPDLAGLAFVVTPPAYTGAPTRTEFDRDVDVLAGSRVAVVVRTDPADAKARARLLPADTAMELTAMPFPRRAVDAAASEPPPKAAEPLDGRGFEFVAQESLRLRFELEDANGLTNPDPGLFAVRVVADERPTLTLLAPSRVEVDTLADGWIPLRARAVDDFGISGMGYTVKLGGDDGPATQQDLAWRVLEAREREADETKPVIAVASGRLQVAQLAIAGTPLTEGQQFTLEVFALDNRAEAAGDGARGRSNGVRVQVVSAEEFLRRIQDRLARVRLSVGELENLSLEKGRRARELIASLESDAPERGASASELSSLHAGARRVAGDTQSLARELCSIAEAVLYARLDAEADAVLIALDDALARAPRSGTFPLEAWKAFGDTAETGRGRASLSGQLAGLVDLSLDLDIERARPAAKSAERAASSAEIGALHEALGEYARLSTELDRGIQDLLSRLAEWDNFQSILSLTKDILNRQKALRERAKAAVGGK